MEINLRGITKSYDDLKVLDEVSLRVPPGGMAAVLGPSGCGKTTLLNIIAGLVDADGGEVQGAEGGVSYLFQEPRLLPWRSVWGNLDVVLAGRLPRAERDERIRRFLGVVGLTEFARYRPAELSGGMRQRVAMARAFAFPAAILLMDEPFQSLDPLLRHALVRAFHSLWASDPRTTLFVTHDVHEAVMLGDRIVLLSSIPATVREVLDNPIPHAERSRSTRALQAVEQRLYRLVHEE